MQKQLQQCTTQQGLQAWPVRRYCLILNSKASAAQGGTSWLVPQRWCQLRRLAPATHTKLTSDPEGKETAMAIRRRGLPQQSGGYGKVGTVPTASNRKPSAYGACGTLLLGPSRRVRMAGRRVGSSVIVAVFLFRNPPHMLYVYMTDQMSI